MLNVDIPDNVQGRNFSTYVLGDNVYDLADGLLPRMADRLDFNLGTEPTIAELTSFIGVLGKNKVLRDNEEVPGISLPELADFAEESGIQDSLNRSLWTPESRLALPAEYTEDEASYKVRPDVALLSVGVANWGDRSTDEEILSIDADVPVEIFAGNRIMSTPTEVTNPHVITYMKRHGRYPTEAMYAARFLLPRLLVAGRDASLHPYDEKDGDELARRVIADNPAWLDQKIVVVRNANAGIQLAGQIREAAKTARPAFDADESNPQLYVKTDYRPLARTAEELKSPRTHQAPQPACRQIGVTALTLHKAAGGQ